jgi:Tol biopolymer transport system component
MKFLTTLLLIASLSAFSQEKTEILIKNETHGDVSAYEPVFSPDGKTLVYKTDLNKNGVWELYSMDLKSGERKRLTKFNETHGQVNAHEPVFSPDGKTLVYSTDLNKDGAFDLYSMDLKSGERKRLAKFNETHGDVDAWEPVISPDGKTLVYSTDLNKDGAFELYSMDLKSGEKKRLTKFNETHGDVDAYSPVFSPDGKTLVYSTDLNKNEVFELYSMDLKSGERKRLTDRNETHGDVGAFNPMFSPDGKTLVYSTDLNKNEVFELYSMDLKSGEKKRLTDRKGNIYRAVLDLYPGKKNINKDLLSCLKDALSGETCSDKFNSIFDLKSDISKILNLQSNEDMTCKNTFEISREMIKSIKVLPTSNLNELSLEIKFNDKSTQKISLELDMSIKKKIFEKMTVSADGSFEIETDELLEIVTDKRICNNPVRIYDLNKEKKSKVEEVKEVKEAKKQSAR